MNLYSIGNPNEWFDALLGIARRLQTDMIKLRILKSMTCLPPILGGSVEPICDSEILRSLERNIVENNIQQDMIIDMLAQLSDMSKHPIPIKLHQRVWS